MPELPEVETIRKELEKYLVGHKITAVEVRHRKILPEGERNLIGGKVSGVRRFGKVTVIDLDNGYSIVTHIKLTGQFIYRGPKLKNPPDLSKKVAGGVPGKHTHVIFQLDRKGILYYNDVRRFGWIKVVKTKDVSEVPFIKKLGPEPFEGLTLAKFKEIVGASNRAIKVLLMDQEKIGGVGNIYANDALWLAKINPNKESKKLGNEEIKRLYNAILKVLKEGLKRGGASELAFVTPDGSEGEYQKYFLAYGQEGQPCSWCHKAKFQKFFLGGRGTYFCPVCQKLDK